MTFDDLAKIKPDEIALTGRWGVKGAIGTEVSTVSENTLRVAVLWGATAWWWPTYYHVFDGFRIHRDGTHEELTDLDGYELD
jgi:hypothetical protein